MTKKTNKKKKNKKNTIIIVVICLFVMVIILIYNIKNGISLLSGNNSIIEFKLLQKIDYYQKKYEEYKECINEKYNDNDLTDVLKKKIEETRNLVEKNNLSVYYYNPNNEFSFTNNIDKTYYAASTIKMLDALYIYKNADAGNIKLTNKVKYLPSHRLGASKGMNKYHVGDSVALAELVKYAIMYSDNTAHAMLLDYIGKGKLREFGQSLGAKNTLVGDMFGEISASDSFFYLKALYDYFNTNSDNSIQLKKVFVESDQNYLNFPDLKIEAATKYGEYPAYYHENGIVFDKNPYLLSILSNKSNNEKFFRSVSKQFYELHTTFYNERENRCKKTIES